MDADRENIIKKLWSEIHGKWLELFYWNDGTTTAYYYDPKSNSIKSENGFSVTIDKETSSITKQYISDLIDTLQAKIIIYYREHYNKNIYFDD